MDKNIDDLTDVLARMDRLETGLGIKIDRFTESEQVLAKWRKELTLEVEELKTLKHSLRKEVPKTLHESLQKSAHKILPELLPSLVKGFQQRTDVFIKSSLKERHHLKSSIDDAVLQVKELATSHNREVTLRRRGVSLMFCLGSLLTTVGIFYFFPQHQFVAYGTTSTMAEFIVLGEAFSENMNKLTPEQKDFFIKKATEKLNRPQ